MMPAAAAVEAPADDDVGEMLRKSVEDFCARHPGVARQRKLRDTEPGFDPAVWRDMAEAGWTGIALPETVGGLGLGLDEICIVAEELAADLAPEPFAAATVAALAIAGGDNAELKQDLLPGILSGELIASFAWQETHNTLDALHPATRLTATAGGRLVLDGEKRVVPGAGGAAGFAVTAAAADGVAIVWVEAKAKGVSSHAAVAIDGSFLHDVRFDGVELGARDVIASPAVAAALLPRLIDEAATIATAELLGIISAALERTREYLGQRTQFGKPIGSFQVLQHRLVDLWMQRELVRACLDEAIAACGEPDETRRALLVSAAKARAAAAALTIGRQSIQLHGAIGYADEHDIGLYLKRAIVKSAWMGNAPVHRKRFARLSGLAPAETTGED
jgi:alkylation response protein AidB-like acyl-CoA dehydrogenase